MPYKDPIKETYYKMGYWAGVRKATIAHLGKKCVKCGTMKNIQVHHKKGLLRQSRQIKDYENLEEIELRCEKHHDRQNNKV